MRNLVALSIVLVLSAGVVGCAQTPPAEEAAPPENDGTPFTITSSAFTDGTTIPVEYTCNGQSKSPPLSWAGLPAGTVSLALIMEDPDAPVKNFTHWVIFNLPRETSGLQEAVPRDGTLADGAVQGKNGGRGIGYIGPCPPKGPAHHYVFTVYALDKSLDLAAGATKDEVRQAMEGHILGQATLIGIYQNPLTD